MKKKKLVIYFILAGLCMVAFSESVESGFESSNNAICLDAAKRIGELSGVETVAVLKSDGKIIAGIESTEETEKEVISRYAESILKGLFPMAKGCRVCVGDKVSGEIIELSYFINTDMEKSIIKSRFMQLWNKNEDI